MRPSRPRAGQPIALQAALPSLSFAGSQSQEGDTTAPGNALGLGRSRGTWLGWLQRTRPGTHSMAARRYRLTAAAAGVRKLDDPGTYVRCMDWNGMEGVS
jgi:hypothetical protein